MTHVAEEPSAGQDRAVGALGVLLGVVLVGLLVASVNVALVIVVMAGTAVGCPMLLRLPPWRPAGVGLLVGMAGAYLAILTLFLCWIAGLGPA